MNEYLIEKIRDKKAKGIIPMEKKISEKQLITEYWTYWYTIDEKEKVKKVLSYPSLEKKDFDKINDII